MSLNQVKLPFFYKDKPLFGMDIGNGSLKVMQTQHSDQVADNKQNAKLKNSLVGYGSCHFDPKAIDNGVVVNPELIAESAKQLFNTGLFGDITTSRVALTIPSYRTFTRSLLLPSSLTSKEMKEAISMEAEQYIPVPIDKLYVDFEPLHTTAEGKEFLMVAVPKEIVDSYIDLTMVMGLEAVLIETTMSAACRLFSNDYQSDVPTLIIDFGSLSSDISIFDGKMLTMGTVQGGGEIFTKTIADKLKVTPQEAHIIKTRYGLNVSKRQKEVRESLKPVLDQIIKEIRRLIRYYEERYGQNRPISQIVTLGGGSNMPGLNEYLTDNLRLAVRPCDPWQYMTVRKLRLPTRDDKQMYATAAGLSMANPKEVF